MKLAPAVTGVSLVGEDIRRDFHGRTVVDVPRVELRAGTTLALLGPSGAGKSTLLSVLGLLETPDAGRVLLDGREAGVRDREARLQMAAVFQRPYLFRGTVADNVAYGLRLRRALDASSREAVSRMLERVGLAGFESRSALTLSGGEAQRVALARALVLEPRVLLLDEPLSSLDVLMKDRLSREFAEILRERRVTTLYVTHDQDEAMVVADDVAIMNSARIVACGPADEVMGLPDDEWIASFLGMEPPLVGVVQAVDDGVARISVERADIYAVSDEPPGTEVMLGVRPEDVLLFEPGMELPRTSARNHLEGSVASVEPAGSTVRVVIIADGARFAAIVSKASARSLGLEFGTKVTVLFKATAVRVRVRDSIADTR